MATDTTWTRESVEAKVKEILASHAKNPDDPKTTLPPEKLDLATSVGDYLDSLDKVEVVMEADEAFSQETTDAEANQLKTGQDAVDLVCKKLGVE